MQIKRINRWHVLAWCLAYSSHYGGVYKINTFRKVIYSRKSRQTKNHIITNYHQKLQDHDFSNLNVQMNTLHRKYLVKMVVLIQWD